MNYHGMLWPAGMLALAVAAMLPAPTRSADLTRTSGVYTVAQAKAGAQLYAAKCSSCHGATLRGGAGPALTGDAFTAQYTGEPASDPYAMMVNNMPQTQPGSLKPAEYLAVMAFILQRNGFAAGSSPLTSAKLTSIPLVAPPNAGTVRGK